MARPKTGAPRVPDLIVQKRDGGELANQDIHALITAYTAGRIPDYQMSALTMAVFFRGMSIAETAALTEAMRDSGKCVDLSDIPGPKVDKHSTGGVGDKVSICLAPIVAACGVRVPMVSGRGLGHTGGTLDKLEAIPGFRVDLNLRQFRSLVRKHGFALIGQTREIAPADRKLYALRDVTGTVESIPLITASILSKKLAEGIDSLVLDCKVGGGAFMKTPEEAEALARSIVRVGKRAGTPVTAILTAMEEPLGCAVGNSVETAEALDVLHGGGPSDLVEVTLALGREMLRLGGVANGRNADALLKRAIRDRSALTAMAALVEAQGGDRRVVEEPDRLPSARHRREIPSPRAGFVRGIDAKAIGLTAMRLGAGRVTVDGAIDPAVGIVLRSKVGDRLKKGQAVAEIHASQPKDIPPAVEAALAAFEISGKAPPTPSPRILRTLR